MGTVKETAEEVAGETKLAAGKVTGKKDLKEEGREQEKEASENLDEEKEKADHVSGDDNMEKLSFRPDFGEDTTMNKGEANPGEGF